MTECELTISFEQTLTVINRCIEQLIDLKIETTKDYEEKLKALHSKEEEIPWIDKPDSEWDIVETEIKS